MSPLKTTASLAVFGALSLSLFQAACSASDPGGGGAANTAGGAPSSAGAAGTALGSAAGSSNGGGGAVGGSGAPASGGAVALGGAPGAGAGGATATAGASGNPSGGSAGAAPAQCTPGTGTTPVGDKSVTDNKTCLTWTKVRSAMPMTNKLAAKYCADLDQDGISAWRVPRPEELVTWPDLSTDSTSYITGPIYIPTAAANDSDGCTGDSHSCNIAKYNDTSVTCGWQGVGFQGWVECVTGTPAAGTTKAAYAAAMCSPCNSELASFKETDCSAYTN
jgi:hypothetical protein